jgi:hypothetical protein
MSWFRRGSSVDPSAAANAAAAANGKPLLLIGFNEAIQKWEVGQEAVAALRAIPGPLASVSVCGRARQGKSFILNTVLGRLTGVDRPKGFVVSPTQQSCTRGIWMWSAPVQVTGPGGRRVNTVSVCWVCECACASTFTDFSATHVLASCGVSTVVCCGCFCLLPARSC